MFRSQALARRLIVALALLAVPSLASAHTGLRRSDPARDSRLAVAPRRITLWFTGRPQLAFSRLRLVGASGDVGLGALAADTGNSLRAEIPGALAAGRYTVHWQTASADGHPIRGEFTFLVGPDTTGATDTAPTHPGGHELHTPQPEQHATHSEYRTVRWIEFVALITMIGVLAFRHAVLASLAARAVPTADAADRARRLGQSAVLLYAIAAVVRLYSESASVHGAARALHPAQLGPMLLRTTWGAGWLTGACGALALFVGWKISTRRAAVGTPLALAGGLALIAAPALSGHAASSHPTALSIGLDALHIAAAGAWIGGLLMVVLAGIPAMRSLSAERAPGAMAALVNSFHPLALLCAPIVVLSGVATSWLRLGSTAALMNTSYGQILLVKVGLVAFVALVGLHNSTRVRRQLGDEAGTKNFRRSAAVELTFAALVLAVTTMLIVTPVPAELTPP